jgi:hypothetical protein
METVYKACGSLSGSFKSLGLAHCAFLLYRKISQIVDNMGIDPEIAPTTSASKTAEVSSQYDSDVKKGIVEGNSHFTAAELAKYGQTHRGLSPRHVQLMAIGGMVFASCPEALHGH